MSYLSSSEVAELLGVSKSTVYAYVSRGQLRSEAVPGTRRKRYPRADVVRLLERGDPEKTVRGALSWGAPVLDSALTLIEDEHLYYRGHDAVTLAANSTVEEVAALLWTGEFSQAERLFEQFRLPWPAELNRILRRLEPMARMQVGLPYLAAMDEQAHDSRRETRERVCARVLTSMVSLATLDDRTPGTLANPLANAWAPGAAELRSADLIKATLIICMDHELNTSAFAARCAASTGANPYAVVSAGLATLEGSRHGGQAERVAAFIDEVCAAKSPVDGIVARQRRGEDIPGFGHPLYSQGDPRGAFLLRSVAKIDNGPQVVEQIQQVVDSVRTVLQEEPSLDVGLVAVVRALELPPGAALALFALGRGVGYLAHAFEAWPPAPLIRPRSRYVGLRPEDVPEGFSRE